MSERVRRHESTMKKVVYQIPGMETVRIQRNVEYGNTDAGAVTMDLYYPEAASEARTPAVVIVEGYSDVGYEAFTGCKFKDTDFCISWGRLIAASGLVGITYTNREPVSDLQALLRHVRQHAGSLGVDEHRIGVWASSGNAPLALSLLMQAGRDFVRCAVLCYPFTLDLDGSTAVAEASGIWKFVNPVAGKSVADLPQDLPLFVARAGKDEFPRLNDTLDRFLADALAGNLPITVVNHHTAPHAFDLVDDTESSREIVKHILAFLRFHLLLTRGSGGPSRSG